MAAVVKDGSVRGRQVRIAPAEAAPARPGAVDHRPATGRRTVADSVRAAELLAELTRGLPRSLMDLSSELLAGQNAGALRLRRSDDHPSVQAAVGAARYVLAEATTAAQVLAQRLHDTAQILADLGDTGAD